MAEQDNRVSDPSGSDSIRRRRGWRPVAVLAVSAALGLAATACSSNSASGDSSAAGATTSAAAKLAACPQSTGTGAPSRAAGAPSGAAPSGAPSGTKVSIPSAKTIKKPDTTNTIVINPTGPQIQCGKTQLSSYSNIVYSTPTTNGKQTRLDMDVQVPKVAGRKPLVIYLTGGGFWFAGQSANLDQRTYLAEQGYVVASISYRTISDGAIYSDAVIDVKTAIRYLRAHASTYDINSNEVALWGQSAGGYLAAMTGVTNGLKQFDVGANLNESSDVQGVVDEFGLSDLSAVGDDYDAATKAANQAPGNNLAQWVYGPGTTKSVADYTPQVAAADPDTYVNSSTPPFVLLQGTADQLVSPSQTLLLNNTLKDKGVSSTRYLLEGANHGDLTVAGDNTSAAKAWSTQVVMGKITSFLSRHLHS
jgi:acetyl esterase/lipase